MRSIYENSPLSPIPVYLFVTTVPSEKHWPLNNVTMEPWIASCSLPRTSWLSTNETEIKVKRNFSAPWCDHFKINKFVSYLVISQSEIGDFYWSLLLITQRRKLFWKEKGWVGETQRVWFTLDRGRLYSRDQSPASCWRHIWDSRCWLSWWVSGREKRLGWWNPGIIVYVGKISPLFSRSESRKLSTTHLTHSRCWLSWWVTGDPDVKYEVHQYERACISSLLASSP